jgi:hypothetical protein
MPPDFDITRPERSSTTRVEGPAAAVVASQSRAPAEKDQAKALGARGSWTLVVIVGAANWPTGTAWSSVRSRIRASRYGRELIGPPLRSSTEVLFQVFRERGVADRSGGVQLKRDTADSPTTCQPTAA